MNFVSENIRRILLEKGISIQSLAKRANLEYIFVKNIVDSIETPNVEDIKAIAEALEFPVYIFFLPNPNILSTWHLSLEELGEIIDQNPSLRGFMGGYIAEYKIRTFFLRHPEISNVFKPDDHDRSNKCDIVLTYRGRQFTFEVKSLQTNSIKQNPLGLTATFQCDASDRRIIELPNGHLVNTTNLKFGDFDIVVINLYAFTGNWDYAFALNRDLPQAASSRRKTSKNIILEEDLKYLIKSSIKITYPLQSPFVSDPFILMNRLLQDKV